MIISICTIKLFNDDVVLFFFNENKILFCLFSPALALQSTVKYSTYILIGHYSTMQYNTIQYNTI